MFQMTLLINVPLMLGVTRLSLHVFRSSRGLTIGVIMLTVQGFLIDCENCGLIGTISIVEARTISEILPKPDVDMINFIW
jgi:hypothetical protein